MDPHVLILGPPGAGKGTQSERIADAFGVEHVTTGDALRANKDLDISHLDTGHDTPGAYMERGELVPDIVVNEILSEALDAADGFVLDGYPRNESQVAYLDEATDLDAILHLDVDRDELVDRLTGRRVCDDCGHNYHVDFDPPETPGTCDDCGGDLIQRDDDTEETVRERLQVFDDETAPVIEAYADRDGFVRVDGNRDPDAVWSDVRRAIEANATATVD